MTNELVHNLKRLKRKVQWDLSKACSGAWVMQKHHHGSFIQKHHPSGLIKGLIRELKELPAPPLHGVYDELISATRVTWVNCESRDFA